MLYVLLWIGINIINITKIMNKFINNVEIQGVVGNVRENQIGDKYVYDVSVCTEASYTSKDTWVIDTTWHSVKIWKDSKLEDLVKGKWVNVKGHLKLQKYVDASGNDRTYQYIYATELNILKNDTPRSN